VSVALVTGAASGIGRATALRFAAEGWSVVACDVDSDGLQQTVAGRDGAMAAVHGDVRRAADTARMCEVAAERFGGLDAVASIAGVEIDRPVDELAEDDWDAVVDTSLKGTYLLCRAAVPALRRGGGGAIVTVGSPLGRASFPGVTAYGAAKAGMEGLTRAMAIDYAPERIRVNCLIPGLTDTPLVWRSVPADRLDDVKREAAAEVPLRRMAAPEEIAGLVLFLCSDQASFITGSSLVADGGVLARIATDH
jgi:NAD(P)-dependent dehydrogenase (short-subunit alcohol dehydrogenase family)